MAEVVPARPAQWPLPFWIAHRGAGKLAPENTLAAFRHGASFGYRAFECDVKLSADGILFLLHDATLERTTSGSGAAGVRPWSELSRLDAGSWHGPTYAGEPIPSFEALSTFIRRNGFALDIEIKPTPGQELETGRAVGREVCRLWAGADASAWPVFTSFRPEALQGARETAPQVPRGLLLDTLWAGWEDVAQALDCAAVITNHQVMSAELAARLHAQGQRALVYTVNDAERVAAMVGCGVDGIVTDAVDRFEPAQPSR
jgi:glycerophosphoryl diester phosphodiesterase